MRYNLCVMTAVALASSFPILLFPHLRELARASCIRVNSCGISPCPVSNVKRMKNVWFPMETVWGYTGVWDGNSIKLDCDDHCTAINIINSLSNINK